MSFLQPALLWALPLAALPVILHLIFLRSARRVPFSDLSLLRAVYARALPATRLRQWLILLLRCLALAAAVLAFARPVFHGELAAAGGERGIDLVLLVDASWSMGAVERGKPRLDWAVAAGRELLRGLRPADRAAVAAFSDRLEGELRWAQTRGEAEEALSRVRVGYRGTDAAAALASAYAFLGRGLAEPARARSEPPGGSRRRRVIVLLSDGARHALARMPAEGVSALPGYDPETALLGLSWPERVDNAGVAEAAPARARAAEGGDRGMITARAALYAPEGAGRGDWTADLLLRERRVDQRSFRLEPGLGRALEFRLPPARQAEHWGSVRLRGDALEADDAFHFSLRVQPRPRVLLLYGSPDYLEAGRGGYFLRKLVADARGEGLDFDLDLADFGRLKEIRLEEYGAVLLADFRRLPAGLPESLQRYAVRGGGVWVLAETRAEPETYRELQRLLPGRLGPPEASAGAAALAAEPGAGAQAAREAGFSWDEFELAQVAIGRRYEVEPAPGAAVWLRDSAGRPLLLAGEFGRGRVLLWASALDLRWTNLALKPVFAALVDAGLRHLTRYAGSREWRTSFVGEPIRREWPPGEAAPVKVQLRSPAGRRSTLLVEGRRIEYRDTREPGIYFLHPLGGDAAQIEAFAVNLERAGREGDLSPAEAPPWRPLRAERLREDFLRAIYGRELRSFALGAALLFLLIESLLARPRSAAAGQLAGRAETAREGVA